MPRPHNSQNQYGADLDPFGFADSLGGGGGRRISIAPGAFGGRRTFVPGT